MGRSVMNIQPIQYNSVSMQGKKDGSCNRIKRRIAQKVLDMLPSYTQKESARSRDEWNKFDNWISKPAQYRALMGVAAIITQPAIDYHNHKVDEETRRISRNRTIAKIIAGTCVGILVRGSAYKAVESMTNIGGKSKSSKAAALSNTLCAFLPAAITGGLPWLRAWSVHKYSMARIQREEPSVE